MAKAVLFACNWNTVRSPMAAALLRRIDRALHVESCGLYTGETVDPFAWAVMDEIGLDLDGHQPKSFDEVDPDAFDLIVALTPEAETRARALADGHRAAVETWTCADPATQEGSREQRLLAYRAVRDALQRRLAERFG